MDEKDKKFEGELIDNLDEIRHGDVQGAQLEERLEEVQAAEVADREISPESERRYHPVSDEEARQMLADEKRQAEASLKAHGRKGRKFLLIAVIVVAILCLGMLVLMMVLGERKGEQKVPEQGQVTPVAPEEPGDGLVEVGIDDEVVQEVWKNIGVIPHDIPFAYELPDGTMNFELAEKYGFYGSEGAVKNGITERQKLALALYALQHNGDGSGDDMCMIYEEDVELINNLGEAAKGSGQSYCIPGEEVRKKYKEIFGDEVELTDGYFSVAADGLQYSSKSDGFFFVAGRGGNAPFVKELYKAERDGYRLYLYEAVAITSYRIGDDICYLMSTDGERITEDGLCTDAAVEVAGIENMDHFKWAFVKNADGNYVFEALEKVK